ncbi:class I SAM-dependent methyltransferase [Cryobacterium sp. TMT1-3]|uniref:Class I SAM-dependent methyltransferase n=1 Tax=Cryobacterium luteum TaxID=1424661 RepID=A0A1H8C948_9MICO|nr:MULTISPECIES: class I SAM-dependent methyltransferase [Cryobacterium]TFB89271.1 class I SAM-dependent methyltransferase [Cryobacterium luteum]TFC27419.1 class I SAM-dependent methyltransferase [Cryobacterium sp. TMT1-3]SEM90758.1 Methyltransferase domain-containing protein [Cryobacterium luteum]
MDRTELVELLSPASLRLLDSLPPYDSTGDVLKLVSDLRKAGHAPGLVSAVLSQSRLRAKASAKFGEFAERMLFTEAGLEQATRLRVAALHAGRFAGLAAALGHPPRVADLGCGIGGDAMALAAMDLPVVAVDADEVTATVASFNLAPFPNASALQADAETVHLADFDAVWLDPARRTSGHSNTTRLTRSEDYSPSLDFAYLLASRLPLGMKLGPGHDRDQIPVDAEAQWVSVDGQLVEMGLWFGALARPGIRRSALLLTEGGAHELTAGADSDDAPVGELGSYVYEPDGAVIRARLIGDLARSLDARMLSESIAYLTNDTLTPTPFASAFRVLETLPFDEKKLRLALLERRIGTLEIKKRGVAVDPATLRTRLKLKGPEAATLILTRVAGQRMALLVERVR